MPNALARSQFPSVTKIVKNVKQAAYKQHARHVLGPSLLREAQPPQESPATEWEYDHQVEAHSR